MKQYRWYILVLFFLALFICKGFFSAPFLSDDFDFLHATADHEGSVFGYFLRNNIGTNEGNTYGPVFNMLFTTQYRLFGLDAYGFHLTTFLFYVLTAFVIFFFVRRLSGKDVVGFLAAALFILLHNHAAALGWIAVQVHVIASFFYVFGVWLYYLFLEMRDSPSVSLSFRLRSRQAQERGRTCYYVFAFLALFSALFIKDTAITFIGVIGLMELWYLLKNTHGDSAPGFFDSARLWLASLRMTIFNQGLVMILRLLPFVGLVVAYLLLRKHATGYLFGYYGASSLSVDIGAMMRMFIELTTNMVVSFPLRSQIAGVFGEHLILSTLVGLGVLVAIWKYLKESRGQLLFCIFAYCMVAVPFVQVGYSAVNHEGERYAYTLSIIAAMFFALLLWEVLKHVKERTMVFVLVCIVLCLASGRGLYAKQADYVVAEELVREMQASVEELGLDDNDYVLFVGMPDNINGAQILRNSVKEFIDLTHGIELDGQRVQMYVTVDHDNYNDTIVKWYQESEYTYKLLENYLTPQYQFTGFPKLETELAIFEIEQFTQPGHRGLAIKMVFDEEKLREYAAEGKDVKVVYFNGGRFEVEEITPSAGN